MEEMDPVFQELGHRRLAAVVTIADPERAVPLARALLEGGVTAMELTLRTEAALAGLERIAMDVPAMLLGAGTIIEAAQVSAAKRAGAVFAVSPGTNPSVLEAAREVGLPFAPGIATPTDIETAISLGCRVLKFFPADGMGGLPYLRNIAGPYRHLGLRYIPLGGVNESNLGHYLESPDVLAVGGSWLAPTGLMEAGDWHAIEKLAARACSILRGDH